MTREAIFRKIPTENGRANKLGKILQAKTQTMSTNFREGIVSLGMTKRQWADVYLRTPLANKA